MTSHALRFLVVVVKIAPSVSRDRGKVSKNQQKRHGDQESYQVFYKIMCSIAIQIQRNSARSFSCLKNEELRSVVSEHFKGKLSSQVLDTRCVWLVITRHRCVAGKRVLTMCQYNFPHEKKNRRGGGSF